MPPETHDGIDELREKVINREKRHANFYTFM